MRRAAMKLISIAPGTTAMAVSASRQFSTSSTATATDRRMSDTTGDTSAICRRPVVVSTSPVRRDRMPPVFMSHSLESGRCRNPANNERGRYVSASDMRMAGRAKRGAALTHVGMNTTTAARREPDAGSRSAPRRRRAAAVCSPGRSRDSVAAMNGPGSSLRGCERPQGPRRPDAAGFDLQPLRGPRLAAVGGAVAGPREAIRPDVVVADAPERRSGAHHAELLLDVHFRTDAVCRAHVLQAGSLLRRDQLPLIEHGVVGAERVGHVVRLAGITDHAVFIEDLRPLGEAHRTPVSVALPELVTHRCELPIAEQVVEIAPVGDIGRPELFGGSLGNGLRAQRRRNRPQRDQYCGGEPKHGVTHDDLTVEGGGTAPQT